MNAATDGCDGALDLERLVRAVSAGDGAALSQLYTMTAGEVFALACFRLRSREDAEEIVLDVYQHVWQHAITYDARRGSVRAWLSIMTRNRAIDRLRRRRASISLDEQQHDALAVSLFGSAPGPEHTVSLLQSTTAVHRALQCLSTERRDLLRLAFFEGLTHEQIAAAKGRPLGTVKSHVRRALAVLQHHLLADAHPAQVREPCTRTR